jgi:hypothetical protein
MKKVPSVLFGLSLLLMLWPPFARAQEATPALREQATAATRKLAAFISLDDARQLPVRRLVQLRLSQEAEVRPQYANDPDMLQKKLTAIGREYTAQLSSILSPNQFARLLAATPDALPAAVAAVPLTESEAAPTPVAAAPVAAPVAAPAPRKAPPARAPTAARPRPAVAPARPRAPASPAVRRVSPAKNGPAQR